MPKPTRRLSRDQRDLLMADSSSLAGESRRAGRKENRAVKQVKRHEKVWMGELSLLSSLLLSPPAQMFAQAEPGAQGHMSFEELAGFTAYVQRLELGPLRRQAGRVLGRTESPPAALL